mmetsp:Transcript_35697/g.43048  ORF Transcript_35697/g.43048 Transcript_35697/m.43048 type:complete len:252 (+) Transcript_35697:1462-2217(+)
MARRHGTEAAINHWLKGLVKTTPSSSASLIHKKFCAAAVRRIEDVLLPPWSCCAIKYERVLLSRLLMIGTNTPPARAVVEGIAGQIAISAAWRPYARERVFFPKSLTKKRARRSPKPVLTNARAKKVATTMSQITSLVRAAKAFPKLRVPVRIVKVTDRNAQAPTGRGLSTKPVTVLKKMASKDQAWAVRVAGQGTKNLVTRPTAMEITAGTIATPEDSTTSTSAASASAAGSSSEAALAICLFRRLAALI